MWTDVTWADARDAASAVCRAPLASLSERGESRTLALQAAWYHGMKAGSALAAASGVTDRSVRRAVASVPWRGAPVLDAPLAACIRVVGDPRFGPLEDGDLRRLLAWVRYRSKA